MWIFHETTFFNEIIFPGVWWNSVCVAWFSNVFSHFVIFATTTVSLLCCTTYIYVEIKTSGGWMLLSQKTFGNFCFFLHFFSGWWCMCTVSSVLWLLLFFFFFSSFYSINWQKNSKWNSAFLFSNLWIRFHVILFHLEIIYWMI